MIILYNDSIYPSSKRGPYKGKTIGEILNTHPNPDAFIRHFNQHNNKYCLSDEIAVDIKKFSRDNMRMAIKG